MDPALTGTTDYGDWRTSDFAQSSVLAAGLLLQKAGERSLAERFLTHLAESLDERGVGQLANLAFELEEPHIALMIAKRAADAGIVVPAAYYPVVDLGAARPGVPPELALAIARRESEFDPVVVSGVGARGLMQLMPATAEEMAGDLGLPYSASRLLSDPAYNATLGVAYLQELIDEFGGNFVLVAAAYNAGPSRPRRWVQDRGDPRSGQIDVIDWIEHVPFTETRNYIMRVMESLPVYRARLSGRTEPLRLSEELVAR
jgi:soluble lytic murein transglycosylase